MRHLNTLLILSFLLPMCVFSQVEKVYDDQERLQTVNPLSENGIWEGVGYSFHLNGGIAKETPFKEGNITGEEKEYYPNGNLRAVCTYREGLKDGTYTEYFDDGKVKAIQEWQMGVKQGELHVYDMYGNLSLYGMLEQDSVVFAQRFDEEGKLVAEKLGQLSQAIDTSEQLLPEVFIKDGRTLIRGKQNAVSISIPKVPTSFIRYSSPDGTISRGVSPYFLLLTPESEAETFTLYLQVQLRSGSQPSLLRTVQIPIE